MNSMFRWTVASALVGGVTVLAGIQSAGAAHGIVLMATPQEQHDHATPGDVPEGGRATPPQTGGMMARMAAMDARIEMLVADMNSFTGEMKVAAMAELLTTLVERQSLMRQRMIAMHDRMMGQMKDRMGSHVMSDGDGEPGTMCAPEGLR